jgi:RNA polymerase-associated protein RTF1
MDIDDSDNSDAEVPPQPVIPARAIRGRPPAKTKVESEEDDMEESSEDESSEDEFSEDEKELDLETLDEKQLIENEADSKHLDSLPEVERESILAERFEKLKAAQEMKIALRENK